MASANFQRFKGTLVAHEYAYRVLILKNPEPAHEHDVVHAVCVDNNLGGRGATVQAALADLADTLTESISFEYENAIPERPADPDPELLGVFEGSSAEIDGMSVLRRGRFVVRIEGVQGSEKGATSLRPGEFAFQPLAATA
jgi:hypothetical protein